MKVLKRILPIFFIVFLTLFLICVSYYFIVTKDVSLLDEKLSLSENSILLYDSENERVRAFSESFSAPIVSEKEIPKCVKNAFVSTEDKRFYTHNGRDWRRIVKAFLSNLKAGSFKQGASTISQQLIKNTHLTQEKTLQRKLKEWKLTSQLEKRYSKEEILEKYLNVIYFGHDCFGLRSASEFYFGKSPQKLTLSEGAILAGLVKSPNNYSPFKNAENCKRRKASVLNAMVANGYITESERDLALNEPLPTTPNVNKKNEGYFHFVFDELTYLAERHGFTLGGNVEIYTYLVPKLQATLEQTAMDVKSDKTIAVLDAKTHGFKGFVSTIGNAKRLPGSLLKPLLVYAPAMEEGLLSPATPLLDEKVNYGGYQPNNFDGKFHGYVSVRQALSKSLNIPAVKVLESLGVARGVSYLEKLSLPVEKDDFSLALALGGMKNGYCLQNLLSAYSTFVNGGNYTKGTFISSIKINGREVYRHVPLQTRVFSEETAYLTTDILKSAATDGTAKKLRSLPFPIAAKTGTVGTEKGNTDAYALSYTTRDIVGVWLGNKDNSFINDTGGGLPCNLLSYINIYLQNDYANTNATIDDFSLPTNVERVTLDKISYYDTHTLLLADDCAPAEYTFVEWFTKNQIPTKKSSYFTKPSILTPEISYQNGKVAIKFKQAYEKIYRYKIDRYDYVTHTTVYEGEYIDEFFDENLLDGKRYVYTITPIYNGKEGEKVVLPTISTSEGILPPSIAESEILEKHWWEY